MSKSQQELEERFARAVSARHASFAYADRVAVAVDRFGLLGERGEFVDAVGGRGLRVAPLRDLASSVHADEGVVIVDATVPSYFGLRALELGADYHCEALDRVAAGKLERKVVAIASGRPLPFQGDELAEGDLAAIDRGLDDFPERMQVHVDHARALAEYLSCCEELESVSYPGLESHPDHVIASSVLRHGYGPAVDFELPARWRCAAGDFIEGCRLNGRSRPAGGPHTRMHARDGFSGSAVRLFAGLDDPLAVADDLDRAMRALRRAGSSGSRPLS